MNVQSFSVKDVAEYLNVSAGLSSARSSGLYGDTLDGPPSKPFHTVNTQQSFGANSFEFVGASHRDMVLAAESGPCILHPCMLNGCFRNHQDAGYI